MISFKPCRTLIGALIACSFLAVVPAANAAVPKDFFGLVTEDVFAGDAAYRTATLNEQASIGIGLIRQTFHWKDIETAPGVYDFSQYDPYVAAAAEHGIAILPILFDPPAFRARISPSGHGTYPPRHYADLGAFGAAVAKRYGPNGSFWQQNPGIPKIPITAYQIWNEPNLPVYWASGPNPKQYARLLTAAYKGIKKVAPTAEIVTAGLPDSHLSKPKNVYGYLDAMLRAKPKFSTLAVNPYAKNKSQLLAKLTHFRRILRAHHDSGKRLWLTELGWSDVGPASQFRAGVSGQAREIRQTIPALVHARHKLHLRGVVYDSWKDGAPYAPKFKDFWGLHTGLLRLNGTAKPALAALQQAIAKSR